MLALKAYLFMHACFKSIWTKLPDSTLGFRSLNWIISPVNDLAYDVDISKKLNSKGSKIAIGCTGHITPMPINGPKNNKSCSLKDCLTAVYP